MCRVPHNDGCGEGALDDGSVELGVDLRGKVDLKEQSEHIIVVIITDAYLILMGKPL